MPCRGPKEFRQVVYDAIDSHRPGDMTESNQRVSEVKLYDCSDMTACMKRFLEKI